MKIQRLQFQGSQGSLLSAQLDMPESKDPVAIALFAHCFTCSKHFKAISRISQTLTEQGYGVFRFDFTGLGESEGEFSDTNFSSNVADLLEASTYLTEHFQSPRILIGHSLGGAAVLQAAGRVSSATGVVSINAPSEPSHVVRLLAEKEEQIQNAGEATVRLGGREFKIKRQFLDDLESHRMEEQIRELKRPILVMHSPRDEVVSIENATAIFLAARHPKSFISLDQADHFLSDSRDAAYVGRLIAAWAGGYLEDSSK